MGIVINAQISHSVLKRIYLDNVTYAQISHSVLKRNFLDNVNNGVSVKEGYAVEPSDSTTVSSFKVHICMSVMQLDLRICFIQAIRSFKCPRDSAENSRQSGFTQTLPTSKTLADNVLVSKCNCVNSFDHVETLCE